MKLPKELERSLHSVFAEMLDVRVQLPFFGFMLSVLVYGSSTYPNGWVRYAPPALGALFVGVLDSMRPWNPYRSLFSWWKGIKSDSDVKDDPAANRLLAKLRSREARRRVILYGFSIALCYDLLVWIGSRFAAPPKTWAFSAYEVFAAFVLWAGVSVGVLDVLMLRWVVATWEKQ